MNRDYPHLRHESASIGTASVCRCGAVSPTLGAEAWGSDCPAALREALAETEARAERAEAERDEMRRELAEAGSRYRDHLPGVMAATEPVELDRPMVMAEVVGERSCFTCANDWSAGRPPFHYCNCTTDGVRDYMAESGAETSPDGLPTDRTMRCPGWAAKETT